LIRLADTYDLRFAGDGRGLSDAEIDRREFRDFPGTYKPWDLAKAVAERCPDDLLSVPGFVLSQGAENRYLTIASGAGLLIPVRDQNGLIQAIKMRRDQGKSKYFYFSSFKSGGPKAQEFVHVPLGTNLTGPILRIAEGPLKADICAFLSTVPTVGIPSAGSTACLAMFLNEFPDIQVVHIALDADYHTNPLVLQGIERIWQIITNLGREPRLEVWGA
jgi:hypothetical protein